jgi:hypothetical protein
VKPLLNANVLNVEKTELKPLNVTVSPDTMKLKPESVINVIHGVKPVPLTKPV